MTTPTCRPDGFIRRRRALRAAWLRTDSGKPCEPVLCDECGRWHLQATTTT